MQRGRAARNTVAHDLWFATGLQLLGNDPVSLVDVFYKLAADPISRHLHAQLCVAVGTYMSEYWVTDLVKGVKKTTGLTWVGFDEAMEKTFRLDRRLYSYVDSCKHCRSD